MWRIYSGNYLKKNRTSSLFLFLTLFVSSFFISFLTTFFYNLWTDEQVRSQAEGRVWQPTILTGIYGVLLLGICSALLILIYHAFEMTKEGRLHQFGILQSIGATPRQLYMALMQEAFALAVVSFLPALPLGIGVAFLIIWYMGKWNQKLQMEVVVRFVYSPGLLFLTAGLCLVTVWLAAHRTARRLSRIGVLEAIKGRPEEMRWKIRKRQFFRSLSSVEWEVAFRSLYARKRAFTTASISITLSFLVLSLFLNFWAISKASTRQTYFERYQDVWDVMLQIEGQTIESELLQRICKLDGVKEGVGFFLESEEEKTRLILDNDTYQAWKQEKSGELPRLRVSYEDYSNLEVISLEENDSQSEENYQIFYQIRAVSEDKISKVETEIQNLMQGRLDYRLENRQREWEDEQKIRRGYEWFMEGICALFACIGIANIFANTLGSIRLRKKEFARYQSMGFSPDSLKKILALEALILAGRPVIICLPFNVLFVAWALSISPPTFLDYLKVMPILPLGLFIGAILAFTAFACYLAGRQILRADIVESLRDDTLY